MILKLYYNTFLVILFATVSHSQNDDFNNALRSQIKFGKIDSIQSDAAIQMANLYKEQNIDSALFYVGLALETLDTSKVSNLNSQYFLVLSEISYNEGKAKEALQLSRVALNKYPIDGKLNLKAKIISMIGRSHHRLGNYDLALSRAIELGKIGVDLKDSSLIALSLNSRGNTLRETNRNDQAIEAFREHYEILIAIGEESVAARPLTNIGIAYATKGELKEAIPYFKRAVDLSLKYDNTYLYAFSSGSAGLNFSDLGMIDSAEVYLNQSLQAWSEIKNVFGIVMASNQLAGMYMQQEEYEQALTYLLPAYEESKDLSTITIQSGIVRNLGNTYEKLGRFKEANEYLKLHVALKDSLTNQEVMRAVQDSEAKYQTEKKETEIKRLSLEDELNQSRIRLQRYGLLGAVGALGILSFFSYRLREKNQRIEKQDAEKEVLLKEIHHRVKNNLQVISSLLGLQGLSVKDAKAKAAIQEGRSRVHSMSLIHQSLYKKDNLTGIEMRPYLDKLISDLVATYNYRDIDIQSIIDCDDMTLDVETVVPIGLIINELVTNSVKYAFEGRSSGAITTDLSEQNSQLILTVSDDGIGLDPKQLKVKEDSFGHSLIRAFKDKLDAQIEIRSDIGTTVRIVIGDYKVIL